MEPQEAIQLTNMISKHLDELVTSLSPEDRKATLSTLRRIFDNIIQHPNDDKYRQIKLTDETFSSKVWQYFAGEELMKISGWVVEDDHVRLRNDSCVQIMLHLLTSFLSSSVTGVVPFPDEEFQALIKAFYNGDILCIQQLLKISHVSPNGDIYSGSGFLVNLLEAATIAQQLDIVKLLLTDYSMDPYVASVTAEYKSMPYIQYIFWYAPQSFIIAIMKHCGVKPSFVTTENYSLLQYAVAFNCFDIVCFLLKECSDIDVNATNDDSMYTPLHLAYLYGHTQIAQYLIQHGADVYAVDCDGCTPYEYIDGDPDCVGASERFQNRRKIHHIPYSIEHCHYMKLVNIGIYKKEAIFLTVEQFPSLKEDILTQPHHDIDHASALKEFAQFITHSTQEFTKVSKKLKSTEKGNFKILRDYPLEQQQSERNQFLF